MDNNIWTREHPEPPPKGFDSLWYWFCKDGETQLRVAEIWPNRVWWDKGWWGPKIEKPIDFPRSQINEQKIYTDSETKNEKESKSIHGTTYNENDGSTKKQKRRGRKKNN